MKARIRFSRRSRSKTVMLGITAAILVVFVGLSYRQWEQYRRANLEAERSREVLAAVDNVLATLADAESGQRGFLLTGQDRYLDPYNRALEEMPNDLATLKKALSEDQRRLEGFDELNSLANQELGELRQTIEARRTQGAQAALAIVLTGEGRGTMDSIRAICARMRRDENANQAQASAAGEAAAQVALLFTVAGTLVLLFLFAFGLEPFASPDPLAWRRSWLLRYGAAILAVAAITLIRAALTPIMTATSMPFTLYFCAVAFAGWFGGLRPAVLSIVLSLLAGSWLFAAPRGSLWVSGHDDQVAMLMIVLVGFGIALLSRSQRNAVDRALRAETSERDERQRFETTLSSIGDAVIATDAEGRVRFMNRVASALLKWPEAEARGRPLEEIFRIVNERTRAAVESPVARVLQEGQISGLANHTTLIARDGTEIPIDDSAAPIRDSGGVLQGTVLVFRDVTERRETERQLSEQARLVEQAAAEAQSQRERLGGIIDSAMDAIITVDASQRIRLFNRAAEQVFRCTASEAAGLSLEDFLPERFRQAHHHHVEQFGKAGVTTRSMYRPGVLWGLRRDGEEFPLEGSISQVENKGEKLFTVILRDITDRKRTEDDLHRERERLGLALTSGKMGVFEVDPIEKTVWWSPETYSLFGVDPAQFQPTRDSFAALIHPEDRELFMQYWDENISEREPIKHEFRILQPNGKARWISCRGTPNDDAGVPTRYSGNFLDITERKEAEQVLRKFEKLSAAARLSAAIAHEINNPLSAVTNLIYLAKGAPGVPESIMEHLALAEEELERVAHAARQALGFYRESSKAEAIDVPDLIESVLKIYSTRIAEKKIELAREYRKCAPVWGVRGEIRQVVSNVLTNAIEAIDEGGMISVAARPVLSGEEQAIEIAVADDGHGIAPEHLDHIFEPFFTTKAGTGTGLGLWVAKEIVERHQGSIEVQSPERGSGRGGTTFIVRLPSGPGGYASHLPLDSRKSVERVERILPESYGAGKLG